MSGVIIVTDVLHHSPTGLQGNQARKLMMKIASSWLQGMVFIRVNGRSNDAMTKMSLCVGKKFKSSVVYACCCIF